MKVYLAADHAGFALKEKVKEFLLGKRYEVEDCGADTLDNNDDYPDYISKAAEKISSFPQDSAIIIGGSGQGEMMLANKYPHVRAALFYGQKAPTQTVDVKGTVSTDPYELVRLSRIHNNANVLALASRFLTDEEALTAVEIFLTTDFPQEDRHARRLKKIENIEKLLKSE